MDQIAIRADHLGKKYALGRRRRNVSFREAVMGRLRRPFGHRAVAGTAPETLWALRDASFEIRHGEAVGIIGRNGAGKSTLLKLLARITEPTEGRARIYGRIGSLLEVGTGFHNELTGRENIYLNGAILGMKKADIDRRFDEIVAFSEVEDFLDTPVKHYSSGMYMRLAFAVAAHLEPEILVIDEVLAVGDSAFQRKCLGKMDDVARQGRTILFVSHDMRAIRSLCQRALYLEGGVLDRDGPAADVVAAYNRSFEATDTNLPVTTDDLVLHRFEILQDGEPALHIDGGRPFDIRIEFEMTRDITLFRIGAYIRTASGDTVSRALTSDWDPSLENLPRGRYRATLEIPGSLLAQGTFRVYLYADRYDLKDYLRPFHIEQKIFVSAPSGFNEGHLREPLDFATLIRNPWRVEPLAGEPGGGPQSGA